MGPLWEATRDMHHACEAHAVGAAMATGKPPVQWYSDWLVALLAIHRVIDPHFPACIHRVDRLLDDIESMAQPVRNIPAADEYIATLTDAAALGGAGYVLTGAHLMGGEIMRRRLEGYPTTHLQWDDRPLALAQLRELRERDDVVLPARNCFIALLKIMDWIEGDSPN